MKWDFVIIGSGFGGSVSAMRLTQKGYRVLVLEEGRRWRAEDFPESNRDLRRYFWRPLLGWKGIQALTWLPGLFVLHGKGVGGGSLVYGNTLMEPRSEAFRLPGWPSEIDWSSELESPYERARRMLGVVTNPHLDASEAALRNLAKELGCEGTFHPTEVGVHFGPGDGRDPYFEGEGPPRNACVLCGGCLVGCRYRAKNSLDYNYLWFAEKWGAEIRAERRAERIKPREGGGYTVHARHGRRIEVFATRRVIVAAGVLGSVELLLRQKRKERTLPRLSDQLGKAVLTNGESLLGASRLGEGADYSRGIAIGAAIHPDHETKIEAVKYPGGSDTMKIISVPLIPEAALWRRWLSLIRSVALEPQRWWSWLRMKDWARRSVILLVMRAVDGGMDLRLNIFGRITGRAKTPSAGPWAQRSAQILGVQIQGLAQNILPEVALGSPSTAHVLGGCRIGREVADSVVDSRHQVHGYPDLFVCDGSVIPANLGVNPSLTITALAERFTSYFPVVSEEAWKERQPGNARFLRK